MPQSSTPRDSHLSALDRYFEISLYLLLLTSVLALVSTGKLDLFTMLAAPATLLVKGFAGCAACPRNFLRARPPLSSRAISFFFQSTSGGFRDRLPPPRRIPA
jgi:hypothetical protein